MRVLSGIQPTGRPHWGNYFGAIKQYIELQSEDQAFYFIANLHALTTVRDGDTLRQLSLDAAMDLLALGLDPNQASLFIQSDVPEISELNWLLLAGTPMGLLERCVSYKDKIAKGLPVVSGLFAYPVLQAADILAYDSDVVPVGEDQKQHIEVCRDIAKAFNHQYGEVFVIPKAKTLDASAKVPGTDGDKMSKSYGNFIEIFEPVKPTCFSCFRCSDRRTRLIRWPICTALEDLAMATSRRKSRQRRKSILNQPAHVGWSWRQNRSDSRKFLVTELLRLAKRRPKFYCVLSRHVD